MQTELKAFLDAAKTLGEVAVAAAQDKAAPVIDKIKSEVEAAKRKIEEEKEKSIDSRPLSELVKEMVADVERAAKHAVAKIQAEKDMEDDEDECSGDCEDCGKCDDEEDKECNCDNICTVAVAADLSEITDLLNELVSSNKKIVKRLDRLIENN